MQCSDRGKDALCIGLSGMMLRQAVYHHHHQNVGGITAVAAAAALTNKTQVVLSIF